MTFFVGSTNLLTLKALRFKKSGAFVNDANVTVTIKKDDVEVAGISWPLAMEYQAGTDGEYVAEVQPEDAIVAGECYVAEVIAVTTSAVPEKTLEKKLRFKAQEDIS